MSATCTLSESRAHCSDITRRARSNFLVPFKTLSSKKRAAFEVIYAFMRLTDDISDDAPGTGRAERFLKWRDGLNKAFDGDPGHHPVFPALVDTAREFNISIELLLELIAGTEQDLLVTRYETFDELREYCYRVASVVGLVSLQVFQLENPSKENIALSEELAIDCGLAFQMTNILRDIDEDMQRDRVYLPQEDLRRFGVTEDDIQNRRLTASFRELMEFQWNRAEEFYRNSSELPAMLTPRARPCLLSMRAIYHALHQQISRRQFDVYSTRVRVSGFAKLMIALRALLLRRGP